MTTQNEQLPPADAGRLDLRVVPLVAWRCTWDGEGPFVQYHDLADPMPTKWDDAPDEVAALVLAVDARAEIERLRSVLEYTAHQLEKARIWGGMDWTYYSLHHMHYGPVLKRLRDTLRPLPISGGPKARPLDWLG